MYTLVRTYGVENKINALWGEHDVSPLKLYEIFQFYRGFFLELTNPLISGPVYVDLIAQQDLYGSDERSLAELLAEPGLALDTVDRIPNYKLRKAVYQDALRNDYQLNINAPGQKPDSITDFSNKTEVAIWRDGVKPKDVHDYCLVTINGFHHMMDYDDRYVYVPEGGRSWRKSRVNTCGLMSFQNIGKVHRKRITFADIGLVNPDVPMSKQVIVSVPEEFRDMSVMFSIGGYLVTPEENICTRIADDLFIINTEMLDITARYFESGKYLDFTSLGLSEFSRDQDKVSLIELQSDEVMSKYLTLPQSFVIAVETPRLAFQRSYVRHSHIPGQYSHHSNPTSPLFLGRGRQADYWKDPDEDQWEILVENGWRPRFSHETVDKGTLPYDSGTNSPYRLYDISRAFLMDIIADVDTVV